jgi:hypothetical protein
MIKNILFQYGGISRSGLQNDMPYRIPVLLYELTTQYTTFDISCENCLVDIEKLPQNYRGQMRLSLSLLPE